MPSKKSSIHLPVNKKVLDALIERDLSLIEGLIDDTRKKMLDIITRGITDGLNPRDIIIDLMEFGIDAARAETIARTEMMYALNTGAKERYKEDDIEYMIWIATDDEKTCLDFPIDLPDGSTEYGCWAMNGKVFRIDEFPNIPAHPRCRCANGAHRGPEDY